MKLDPPQHGAIIRYAYLWADEHRLGREEAGKDRPPLVLALSVRSDEGKTEVLVLAVTHSPPEKSTDAVALPAEVKRRLRLDSAAYCGRRARSGTSATRTGTSSAGRSRISTILFASSYHVVHPELTQW